MEITIQLPDTFEQKTVRELLETEWLIPRKVRHFLRVRKNVQVNGQTALFHQNVLAKDQITLTFEDSDYTQPAILLGNHELVDCLFEDDHLIILNKPSGMKTHPNQPNEKDTLLNHLAAYLAPNKQIPYVVHRLDKETSGAIVFAKNPIILPILGRMLETKQIYRRYQAIVNGMSKKDSWTITKKIGRDRHDRRKRRIDSKKGDTAITHVTTDWRDESNHQTGVYCLLDTGRTHQIRVHLASENLPIVNDPLYNQNVEGRLMLHAIELHLLHPFTKERIVAKAKPSLW